jgi:hypothetical protein
VEGPVALLSSLFANSNRDPKKQKEPFSMKDFYLYEDKEDMNIPSSVYGSAAMALASKRLLPSWALFIYKDLRSASDGNAPELLAYIGDDVLLLAPAHRDKKIRAMVVSMESSYGKVRHVKSPCGRQLTIKCPIGVNKFFAQENLEVHVVDPG